MAPCCALLARARSPHSVCTPSDQPSCRHGDPRPSRYLPVLSLPHSSVSLSVSPRSRGQQSAVSSLSVPSIMFPLNLLSLSPCAGRWLRQTEDALLSEQERENRSQPDSQSHVLRSSDAREPQGKPSPWDGRPRGPRNGHVSMCQMPHVPRV